MRKIIFLTLCLLVTTTTIACQPTSVDVNPSQNDKTLTTDGLNGTETTVDSGSYAGKSFKKTLRIQGDKGHRITFSVTNDGDQEITTRVNDSDTLLLEPGGSGDIFRTFSGDSVDFTFEAHPATPGDAVDIRYAINQGK